ncbi:hypothetical protein, partial [Escherichia coli]
CTDLRDLVTTHRGILPCVHA